MEEVTQALPSRGFRWPVAAGVLAVVALLRGLKFPAGWPATQALIDYHAGFVKRGLYGETLGHWLHLERYSHFVLVSCVWLLIGFSALLAVSTKVHRVSNGIVAAVFFGSFAATYLASLIGYTDLLLITLTCALLMIRNARTRALVGLPLCLLGVVLHEAFLMIFLPVILLSFLVDLARGAVQQPFAIGAIVILASTCAALFAALALHRPMTGEQVATETTYLAQRVNFPLELDVFRMLSRSMPENRKTMTQNMYLRQQYRRSFRTNLAMEAPAYLLLLLTAIYTVARQPGLQQRGWLIAATVGAAVAPLSLHLVAWDAGRFFALSVVSCFLVVCVVSPSPQSAPIAMPRWYLPAALVAIACGILPNHGLIEGEPPNPYPFTTGARLLAGHLRSGDWRIPAW